ncbi:MAG: hypothetical protein EAX81_05615 [Candidatus Thorarchaeota archaeon]|nr:hypothetical protein [Candidatus Thorarchaeota archaeon]
MEEKRRSLAQEMRHAVMTLHYGPTKLKEFGNRLDSAKRTLVSLRMANFLHYHWLEDKLEEIQEELPAIKNRITNQGEIIAKRMAAETKGLMDYNRWTPDQFPFIEGVTNRISEIGRQYKQNTDDAFQDCKAKLKELVEQLDGLNFYRSEFSAFYEHVDLSVGELPVCALPEVKVIGSDFLKHDKASGTLYMTNKRLILIAERGLLWKNTGPVFDFPLIYLNSLEEDGRFRKKLVLRMKQGYIRISCSEETMEVLPDYVSIAKRFDKYVQKDMQRVRKIEQANVNISDVRMKIESLVYSLLTGDLDSGYYGGRIDSFEYRPDIRHGERGHYGSDYGRQDVLKEELNRRFGLGGNGSDASQYEYASSIDSLKRSAIEIQDAIHDTIRMMRSGHLVAEDFIRRYRGLVRDSYETQKQIERIDRTKHGYGW